MFLLKIYILLEHGIFQIADYDYGKESVEEQKLQDAYMGILYANGIGFLLKR